MDSYWFCENCIKMTEQCKTFTWELWHIGAKELNIFLLTCEGLFGEYRGRNAYAAIGRVPWPSWMSHDSWECVIRKKQLFLAQTTGGKYVYAYWQKGADTVRLCNILNTIKCVKELIKCFCVSTCTCPFPCYIAGPVGAHLNTSEGGKECQHPGYRHRRWS